MTLHLPVREGDLTVFDGDLELGRVRLEHGAGRALLSQPEDVLGDAVELVAHAPAEAALDILVLAEGYTEDERERFHADADELVTQLEETDFGEFWPRINIWRQDVRSRESGVDELEGRARDSAFDVAFGVGDVARCAFPDTAEAQAAIVALGERVSADVVAVLVNSDTYGGCAGEQFSVNTRGYWGGMVLAHELGHTLFGLADEYDYGECEADAEAPNISPSHLPEDLPWAELVTTGDFPTTPEEDNADLVGAFEGASYCETGMYRPQLHCMMRELGMSFCSVCSRELSRYFDALAPLAPACDGACVEAGAPDGDAGQPGDGVWPAGVRHGDHWW